jgi:hypothetical protein
LRSGKLFRIDPLKSDWNVICRTRIEQLSLQSVFHSSQFRRFAVMKTVRPHDPITHADLERLAAVDESVCVSLYLPTHPAAPESHQDPVRLRNLLDEAESRLLEQGQRRPDVQDLLQPAREMISDDFYWTHQSEGLAVFLRNGSCEKYRLPTPFEPTVEIAGQFLVTPIVWLLKPGQAFYLLAVSQNSCRLFRGTQFEVEEVELDEMPKDLQSALGWWRERELSFHSQPRSQNGAAIFHGHEEDDKRIDLTAYLRKVANPLKPMLHNRAAPLVFAGVEEMFPIFRDVFGKRGLIEEHITGNPDHLSDKQLHQRAWPIVERHIAEETAQIWQDYHAARNQDRATNDLAVILKACRSGLVETLLLAEGTRRIASFDNQNCRILGNGDAGDKVDVLNVAAVSALRTGADVVAVPMSEIPKKQSAAAILRGPISAIQNP